MGYSQSGSNKTCLIFSFCSVELVNLLLVIIITGDFRIWKSLIRRKVRRHKRKIVGGIYLLRPTVDLLYNFLRVNWVFRLAELTSWKSGREDASSTIQYESWCCGISCAYINRNDELPSEQALGACRGWWTERNSRGFLWVRNVLMNGHQSWLLRAQSRELCGSSSFEFYISVKLNVHSFWNYINPSER